MSKYFDANNDGQYDMHEFYNWLLPANHNPYRAESLHLFSHADENKVSPAQSAKIESVYIRAILFQDNLLSRDEMLNAREVFVGQSAP